MVTDSSRLVWIDMEMTGLDVFKDRIIEIATVITDANLTIVAEGPVIAVYQPPDIISLMDDWNYKTHTKSGLYDRVKRSTINEQEAERETLDFLKLYLTKNSSPMCGNSIYQDRKFLCYYMPSLEKYFHYRNIDVTTLRELFLLWGFKNIIKEFKKENRHEALADVYESIGELKYYYEKFFSSIDKKN